MSRSEQSLQDACDVLRKFGDVEDLDCLDQIEPLGGLSNRNYRVTLAGQRHVLRIASPNADELGISRAAEGEVLRFAAAAGLGPEVIDYSLPEGHLLTREIEAAPLSETPERYRKPDVLRSVVRLVRRIHALPAIDHGFDPFARIRTAFVRARGSGVTLPEASDRVLEHLDEIEATRGALPPSERALCHNDLFAGNLLDVEPVRVIDWEFAGMGDVFFDLATLVVATDEASPLEDAHRELILEEYFGNASREHRRRLDDMTFVVRLHVVAWGLTHHRLGTCVRGWPGFTFLGFSRGLLEQLGSEI